ncbi:flagellar motor switch protein FliM [Porticoccus sp.]
MSQSDVLLQDEIDALLNTVSGDSDTPSSQKEASRIRPYNPATQHRIIRERLHALDIVNERFARLFRISLFNLIRRNADITVDSMRYESYSTFSRNVPVPTNINLVSVKPLRGTAMVVFPPNLVFMVVDNLFGGDGRFHTKSEGREFTSTEQRIIRRLLSLATDAYQESWQAVFPVEISYLRSEMQAKFANITNSPNEIVVNTTFHLEVGNHASDFQICMPFAMIEPLKDLLVNPVTDRDSQNEALWNKRIAGEIKETHVEIVADFASITRRISEVLALKVGDVLPITLPEKVTARIDSIPIIECDYGSLNEHRALSVSRVIEHAQVPVLPSEQLNKHPSSRAGKSKHE